MRTLISKEIHLISGAGVSHEEGMENVLYAMPGACTFAFMVTPPAILTSPVAAIASAINGDGLADSLYKGAAHAALGFTGAYDMLVKAYHAERCY